MGCRLPHPTRRAAIVALDVEDGSHCGTAHFCRIYDAGALPEMVGMGQMQASMLGDYSGPQCDHKHQDCVHCGYARITSSRTTDNAGMRFGKRR